MPKRRRKKPNYFRRGKTTASICREVVEKGIFDSAFSHPGYGQPGAWAVLRRGDYEASLRREGTATQRGYNAGEEPTRITYLWIVKNTRTGNTRDFGYFDPLSIPPNKTTFEKKAEKNPKLKQFLEDILEHFNHY